MQTELQEILDGKHPMFQTAKLKAKLVKAGLKRNQCEACGVDGVYNGLPLVMHLDHIDGKSTDHRLENLRMLCPNCHSQTSTYSGRNKMNDNRILLADKRAEKKRIAEAKHKAMVEPRVQDYLAIEKDVGYIQRLAEKWEVSHTQVSRFIKQWCL
jgi:Zn finger protein HypA/HybF involved in hydrogenase expression